MWARDGQLQRFLDRLNWLDLFQSGFQPDNGTEMALVTLHWKMDSELVDG